MVTLLTLCSDLAAPVTVGGVLKGRKHVAGMEWSYAWDEWCIYLPPPVTDGEHGFTYDHRLAACCASECACACVGMVWGCVGAVGRGRRTVLADNL